MDVQNNLDIEMRLKLHEEFSRKLKEACEAISRAAKEFDKVLYLISKKLSNVDYTNRELLITNENRFFQEISHIECFQQGESRYSNDDYYKIRNRTVNPFSIVRKYVQIPKR